MSARIAVSIGCPCGIGPEVSVVAAASERRARVLLVGDERAIREAATGRRIAQKRIVRVARPEDAWGLPRGTVPVWQPTGDLAARDRAPGKPTARSGAAQLAWIDAACDLVAAGGADALATGPVSKEAIVRSGLREARAFRGHTEHLQRRLRSREVVMAFWSPRISTSLVTTHLPLARVPAAITPAAVERATFWLAWLVARLERRAARVAVASLNPHAGEGGLLGREEEARIAPGIDRARARLRAARVAAAVEGPVPAESAMRLAVGGRWDGVVAMYHDQATIPMKLVDFGEAVNVSLGLPIVRTSVDHGTGYDRAGTWTADARGMKEAIAIAARLAAVSDGPRAPRRATRAAARRPRRRSA
ncbi:MAG TPA: 4-hydroxythreonine-4-phosphate dehydrogenase PdxA [Polyangiaceae bacterium]